MEHRGYQMIILFLFNFLVSSAGEHTNQLIFWQFTGSISRMSELVAQNVLKSNTYHCTLQYVCSILSLCSLLQQCCESLPIIYSISERNVSPLHLPFIKKTEGNALFHKTHGACFVYHYHTQPTGIRFTLQYSSPFIMSLEWKKISWYLALPIQLCSRYLIHSQLAHLWMKMHAPAILQTYVICVQQGQLRQIKFIFRWSGMQPWSVKSLSRKALHADRKLVVQSMLRRGSWLHTSTKSFVVRSYSEWATALLE